jgi:hypothetical protein
MELNKPQARWKGNQIRSKIQRWLSGQFLEELIRYQIESREGQWRLQFDLGVATLERRTTGSDSITSPEWRGVGASEKGGYENIPGFRLQKFSRSASRELRPKIDSLLARVSILRSGRHHR